MKKTQLNNTSPHSNTLNNNEIKDASSFELINRYLHYFQENLNQFSQAGVISTSSITLHVEDEKNANNKRVRSFEAVAAPDLKRRLNSSSENHESADDSWIEDIILNDFDKSQILRTIPQSKMTRENTDDSWIDGIICNDLDKTKSSEKLDKGVLNDENDYYDWLEEKVSDDFLKKPTVSGFQFGFFSSDEDYRAMLNLAEIPSLHLKF